MTTAETMARAAMSAESKAAWRNALATSLPSSTEAENSLLDSKDSSLNFVMADQMLKS